MSPDFCMVINHVIEKMRQYSGSYLTWKALLSGNMRILSSEISNGPWLSGILHLVVLYCVQDISKKINGWFFIVQIILYYMILHFKMFIYLCGWGLHLRQYNRKMKKKTLPWWPRCPIPTIQKVWIGKHEINVFYKHNHLTHEHKEILNTMRRWYMKGFY